MVKRIFDLLFSVVGFIVVGWLLFLFWIMASVDTKSNGLFIQERVGQWGKIFRIYKLKTIHPMTAKISRFGNFLRKTKIDELPQLFNILKGEMSVVGPRPDIAGYYDVLILAERKILELKPGLTSLASIKYASEEQLLAKQKNPLQYNDAVIFPDKVKMNLDYYYNWSLCGDIKIIWQTIFRKQ
jgi:lipopolysaccharide/colanic/teichoic acid biosynthesis glycosyltransferase